MSYDPEHVVCRVCRTSLDVTTYPDSGDVKYSHAKPVVRQFGSMVTDHEPDPIVGVAVDDIVGVCDFCAARNPHWEYPCKSFVVEATPQGIGMGMIQNWAACQNCHDLIEADNYMGLAARSIDKYPDAMPPEVQLALVLLQTQFRLNRSGPARNLLSH